MRAHSWLGASLVLVLAAAACAPDDPDRPRTETSAVIANRNLDILFMIDNSSSMRLSQANLEANFPGFMDVLKNLPGGLPNIHVAVVSSDMGAGDGSIASCSASGGDNGIFKYTPAGNCAVSPLAPNATYLSNVGGVANYTGDISTLFSCVAALGEGGCGFEQTLLSVTHALGADNFDGAGKKRTSIQPSRAQISQISSRMTGEAKLSRRSIES